MAHDVSVSLRRYIMKAINIAFCLWLAFIVNSAKPANASANDASNESEKDYTLKVGVEEVRIDATVLDGKGRQVPDLTSDDFEIFQDGKLQKIISCAYVGEEADQTIKKGIARDDIKAGLLSLPLLTKEEVRRTFVFLIDDYNMSFEDFHFARMALKKYVEMQMESGDLVSIIKSGSGVGAEMRFSSDKRQIASRINNISCGESGCRNLPFPWMSGSYGHIFAVDASLSYDARRNIESRNNNPTLNDIISLPDESYRRRFDRRIAMLKYSIMALADMPGRKSLIHMSSEIDYNPSKAGPDAERKIYELSDLALRAGVVVHTLDMAGLTVWSKTKPFDLPLPLSKKTGGLTLENSNFFLNGIGPVEEALRGYYLLSYKPPANTFVDGRREVYHRIRIKVKKHGLEVHSRDGFYITDRSSKNTAVAKASTLQQAIFSPFRHNDLKLNLSAGFAFTPEAGHFLKTWLHLDGEALAFKKEAAAEYSLALELLLLTADLNGNINDLKSYQYDFRLNDNDILRIKKDGIDLNAYLPVKKAGDYYVRAAVKDKASGKIGSGYQSIEIPDLKKRRLFISSIFVLNKGEDASAVKSDGLLTEKSAADPRKQKWQSLEKSPAIRTYAPGDDIDFLAIVYNARSEGERGSKLEIRSNIYRDGQIYFQGKPEEIDIRETPEWRGIPIIRKLEIDNAMEEGLYLFQLTISDKKAVNKFKTAGQAIDFRINKKLPR